MPLLPYHTSDKEVHMAHHNMTIDTTLETDTESARLDVLQSLFQSIYTVYGLTEATCEVVLTDSMDSIYVTFETGCLHNLGPMHT